ncbi:MAG: hypothetical protein IJ559_02810 [Prevotella sp.]|nr:hypothetical protein [Prevotella sp.]
MDKVNFVRKGDLIEIHLGEKIVKVAGHLDSDCFRIFTESFETSSLTDQEREIVRKELQHRNDIIID